MNGIIPYTNPFFINELSKEVEAFDVQLKTKVQPAAKKLYAQQRDMVEKFLNHFNTVFKSKRNLKKYYNFFYQDIKTKNGLEKLINILVYGQFFIPIEIEDMDKNKSSLKFKDQFHPSFTIREDELRFEISSFKKDMNNFQDYINFDIEKLSDGGYHHPDIPYKIEFRINIIENDED